MDEFADSTPLRGDGGALRGRLADEGYLFFRRLLPADEVADVRRGVLTAIHEAGWLAEGSTPQEARPGPTPRREMADDYWDGYTAIQRNERFHRLAHTRDLLGVLRTLIADEVLVHPRKIARVSWPFGMAPTPPHQDFRYIQGTVDVFTVWSPLGAVPADLGGLRILRGSQDAGLLPIHEAEGAGGLEVETDDDDPDWAATEYEPGDVLLFHSLTVHGALPNQRDELRLSVDYRYQAISDPVAQASLHPHFHPRISDWDALAAEWDDREPIAVPGDVRGGPTRLPQDDLDPGPSRFVMARRA